MQVLFVSLLFVTLGNLYCSGGLLQAGKEKIALLATAAEKLFMCKAQTGVSDELIARIKNQK